MQAVACENLRARNIYPIQSLPLPQEGKGEGVAEVSCLRLVISVWFFVTTDRFVGFVCLLFDML